MNTLIIDLTHGGVKIATSLAKKNKNIYAYDIYNTLKDNDRKLLEKYNVKLIDLTDLKNLNGDIKVISPIHIPLTNKDITNYNSNLNYIFITHHQAVKEILENLEKNIPKIEVTGVKGKTSSVFMLKEILSDTNPLILSSLGAYVFENKKEIVLKKDISITPANIIKTVELAENKNYKSAIFESSLGVCGIGDIGLLTNIVENYPIAKNKSNAATAKKQVFNCNLVVCQKEVLDKYYSDITHTNTNTFSMNDINANLYLKNVDYSLDKTNISLEYVNVKTVNGNVINGNISINTFAPGRHHVLNVLGVVLTSLSLNITHEKIINGLEKYKGITGRTNKKIINESIIIEEINPGINTESIKESVNMIKNLNDYYVVIGGDYGVTCEEIDEMKVSKFLDTLNCSLILTGDVGLGIYKKMNNKPKYINNYEKCYNLSIKNNKNLLFVYRSNYNKLSQR